MKKKNKILLTVLIIFFPILFTLFFSSSFRKLEDSILASKFKIRGETQFDSSIVILYLDNDDIKALGGWPARRDYYALLINVLNELEPKVIGFDIALAEYNYERPQLDTLLGNVVKNNNNIVFVSYFQTISDAEPNLKSRLPEALGYITEEQASFLVGENISLPFELLIEAGAKVGHENLTEDSNLPMFIYMGREALPSFPFEILRLALDAKKSDVKIFRDKVEINLPAKNITIPYSKTGTVDINYPGGVNSINAIPIVDFLQSYHLKKRGSISDIPVEMLKNKIVLVGVIAEGRSQFFNTPFSAQFPSVAVHASIIDNALNQNFLRTLNPYVEYSFILFAALLITLLIFNRTELESSSYTAAIIIIYIITAFIVFSLFDYEIPVLKFLFVQLFISVGFIFFRNQITRKRVFELENEKSSITKRLQDREEKLHKLQRELKEAQNKNEAAQTAVLIEEIQKYKQELHNLSSEASDLEIYELHDSGKFHIDNFQGIIYNSNGPMKSVVEFIKKISDTDAPVLILGESGTGKELVARAIHTISTRKGKPFIAVNCGALSETLLESELFGHERGAFTGAIKDKPGRFELADGGTIFLDEIAETSETFQVKLLRILQEGEFERVGGTVTKKINVRVVAATNRDLPSEINLKNFRKDLYYRLSVFIVSLPPLRNRGFDIPVLAEHYLKNEDNDFSISSNVMNTLINHNWPGNIRELYSVIKRAVVLARSEKRIMIRHKDLPEEIKNISDKDINIEEQIIESLRMKEFSFNSISETAKELEINRGTVAEHFRGYCFQEIIKNNYDIDKTISIIANSNDSKTIKKVEKKVVEYLANALEFVEKSQSPENNLKKSRPKFKNLPQKFHRSLETVIIEYHKGTFKI